MSGMYKGAGRLGSKLGADLAVTYRRIAELEPFAGNPRTHSKKQIRQIARSIREFGWTNPVLIDAHDRIIAGHGRVRAASLLGLDEVPTLRLEHLNEEQRRAYIIADNKLAELAGWDDTLLAVELDYLAEMDFDVTLTGFEVAEADILIGGLEELVDEDDEIPPIEADAVAISRPGDLWHLGDHRLLCGDALAPESFRTLLGEQRAQMVFVDPPYNVPIDGHVCGLGSIRHREFAMASGEMDQDAFTAFLRKACSNLAAHSIDGSVHYVCMDWRHLRELLAATEPVYRELKNICVWVKSNAGMGSLYRSQHELVCVFKNGTAGHVNNVELGKHGRYRTNVWNYAGVNAFRDGRLEELGMHPTVKPVALVADAILDCSTRGAIVLESFAGSGTTVLAAEKTGRRARAIEIDPVYVDVAIQRWQKMTGAAAIHAGSGMPFSDVADARRTSSASPDDHAPSKVPTINHTARSRKELEHGGQEDTIPV